MDIFGNMNSGYSGYSMSQRAREAYNSGEMPLSKWTKATILDSISLYIKKEQLNISISNLNKCSKEILKEYFLYNSSWHHTSKFCNKTDFYSLDTDLIETLTADKINNLIEKTNKIKLEKRKDSQNKEVIKYYKVEYLKWRERSKCVQVIDFGEIRGDWFYAAGYKKNINTNGFKILKEISKRSVTINRNKQNELARIYNYQNKYRNLDTFLYKAQVDDSLRDFIKNLRTLRRLCMELKKAELQKNKKLAQKINDDNFVECKISSDFINYVKKQFNIIGR